MITLRQQAALAAGILASALVAGHAVAESHLAPASTDNSSAVIASGVMVSGLSPSAAALRVEIAMDYRPEAMERAFYEARNYAPLWTSQDGLPTPDARALIEWAGQADANGLPVGRYNVSELTARIDQARVGAHNEAAALEVELTRLFLTFGRDITSGLLEPRKINRNMDIELRRRDPAALLADLAAASSVPDYLASLIPADPAYVRLRELYATMRSIAQQG